MALLKQIKFGNASTPIAMTQVAIAEGSSKALSVVSTNTDLDVESNPSYTIALAVDGKTITKTGNDGLATALQLKYHPAVTTQGSEKGAYIALEDNTGTSISGCEVMVADIIGNGVLKSSSYSETTGVLTLVFATASGIDQTVEIDLGELLDIDDIIIEQNTAVDYLSFDLADPASETGQAVLGVKLADVTYTASTGSTDADLAVSTTNGKMLDASNAIPAIKGYVLDVLSSATASLAVTAQGDNYITAAQDSQDNKKINVSADVQTLTATAGTAGVYDADGQQTTAPVAGTLSGVADSLADGADIATKVKTYVDGAIAIEGARSDAKNKADIKTAIEGLDVTDTAVDSQYVSAVSETDGKVTVSRADVSAAKLNNYVKGSSEGPIAATDTINQAFSKIEVTIENNEETTSQALNDLEGKINAMDKAASAVNGQVVTTISETDGVVAETKANVKDLQLGGYSKDSTATGNIASTDTINAALSKLENAAAASSTTVAEGTDAGNNMSISVTTDANDGHKTYTINLTDVASKTALDAEIAARKAVDGQNGQTYAANSNANYISAATSLNDADVKLDAAIKAVDNRIDGLDLADTAETGKVVVAVDETNGLVAPEKANLSGITLAGFTANTTKTGAIAATDTVADALNKLQNKADAIQYRITGTTLEFFGMTENSNS